MPIEITAQTNSQPATTESTSVQVARNTATAAQNETGQSASLDTVSLTDTSALMQQLDAAIVNLPVVDTQRVEAIQKSIADGSFKMDAESVADKLMATELSLDGK